MQGAAARVRATDLLLPLITGYSRLTGFSPAAMQGAAARIRDAPLLLPEPQVRRDTQLQLLPQASAGGMARI